MIEQTAYSRGVAVADWRAAGAVPGMDRIEQECRGLVDPEDPADPSYNDVQTLILRMRGYLLQLVAAVEEPAERRPPTEPLGARARYLTTEARLFLDEIPDAHVLPRMYDHARRAAQCALGLVDCLLASIRRRRPSERVRNTFR
ncbi:DUF6415 family natural product biosynthesis protein [Streptomyces sp. NPDC059994]|uniref:DUF6415 family natural product biosynthesis protein n=1 Tax=Streptomyces sp. NPDC059994 TaxID=3347029 RepID=UPI003673676C